MEQDWIDLYSFDFEIKSYFHVKFNCIMKVVRLIGNLYFK